MLLASLLETAEVPRQVGAEALRDSTPLGARAESLYVALLSTGPAYRPGGSLQQQPGGAGHSAYMRSLTVNGTLVLGGPYGDDPHRRIFSGAVLVLRAAALEDARRIVSADPGIASGLLRVVTVSRWIPAAGTLARGLRNPPAGR